MVDVLRSLFFLLFCFFFFFFFFFVQEGKTIVPNAAKGEAVMLVTPEDGLMHFRWATRPEGIVELDLILFEGDAAWKRVSKVRLSFFNVNVTE